MVIRHYHKNGREPEISTGITWEKMKQYSRELMNCVCSVKKRFWPVPGCSQADLPERHISEALELKNFQDHYYYLLLLFNVILRTVCVDKTAIYFPFSNLKSVSEADIYRIQCVKTWCCSNRRIRIRNYKKHSSGFIFHRSVVHIPVRIHIVLILRK